MPSEWSDPLDEQRYERQLLGDIALAVMAMEFPAIEQVCGPVTTSQILMLAGEAGVGKSLWSLAMAAHIACGGAFGGWQTPKARRVLYVDGELPGAVLQMRLAMFPNPKDLRIMFQSQCNLADAGWRELFLSRADQFDVVFFDTVSSLIYPASEAGPFAPEYWLQVTPFNDLLANMGKTVIWIDHLNKEGKVFGTNLKHHKVSDMWLMKKNPAHETGFFLESIKGRNAPSRVASDWIFNVLDGWSITNERQEKEAMENTEYANRRDNHFQRGYGRRAKN